MNSNADSAPELKSEPTPGPRNESKKEPNPESNPAPNPDGRRRVAKPIHRFVLQAAIGLFVLGWVSGQSRVYPRLIHAQADALFAWAGSDRWLEFSWVDPESRRDRSDTRMLGMTAGVSGEAERRWRAVFSVRRRGFWPLATWLAVMLATPMPMAHRLRGWVAGAIVLDLLLMGQIALIALCAFGATEAQPDPLWARGAAIATALFNSPVPTYSLVFVLWAWLANPAQAIALSGAVALLRRCVGLDRKNSR